MSMVQVREHCFVASQFDGTLYCTHCGSKPAEKTECNLRTISVPITSDCPDPNACQTTATVAKHTAALTEHEKSSNDEKSNAGPDERQKTDEEPKGKPLDQQTWTEQFMSEAMGVVKFLDRVWARNVQSGVG
eukprot:TRINITY_DN67900_c7_g2_i4.p1 TRINITY_DN67900_c7_g2~~TRINITY_DN67900_c7_g2_i4.p1  ORF type:complete len:132 (+),score=4.22 TRINITY_DN67900_c7_g2_i4:114-509(+)